MAHTDDIAEKVSDLLMNETVKGGAFITTAVPPAVSGLAKASNETIQQLREAVRNNKDIRRLMRMEGGEVSEEDLEKYIKHLSTRSSVVPIADSDANEFADLLTKNKVMFARLDRNDDNSKRFIFLNQDREKVQNLLNVMQARRGLVTELNPDLFFNGMQPSQVKEVSGLDHAELELFRHYARLRPMVFTTLNEENGKHSVYFEKSDEKTANRILLDVGWALSGRHGLEVRNQLEDHLRSREELNKAIMDPQKELFVVSATNPSSYIHINKDDFTEHKKGKAVMSTERERNDFAERCMTYCDGLEHPVVLQPDEFTKVASATDMAKYPTMDFLSKGFEEAKEQDKLNNLLSLVARKAGLDNENDADITLWDSSVSFSEFAANENYEDNEARAEAQEDYERLQSASAFPNSRYAMETLDMDQRNLDFIITRAEQKRRAQSGAYQGKEQDRNEGFSL